jgi:hypothetical protein
MNITTFFTNNGTPATGLTPHIDIWDLTGTQVVTNQVMTEIAGGFYVYDFTTYSDTTEYAIRADGGATLSNSERYVSGTNELGEVTDKTKKSLMVNANKLIISSNVMTIYADDGTTPLYQYDLKDESGLPSSENIFQRLPK